MREPVEWNFVDMRAAARVGDSRLRDYRQRMRERGVLVPDALLTRIEDEEREGRQKMHEAMKAAFYVSWNVRGGRPWW